MQRPFVCLSVLLVLFGCTLSLVAQQAASASGRQGQINAPVDPNEIFCTSGTACKTGFVPVFATAGGNATITSSIVTQSGNRQRERAAEFYSHEENRAALKQVLRREKTPAGANYSRFQSLPGPQFLTNPSFGAR